MLPLRRRSCHFCTSVGLGTRSATQNINLFRRLLGLKINISKTEVFPIRVDENTITNLLQNFPGKTCKFPGKYLGLPLHIQKLRKVDVQPLIDKVGARLPGWKGRLLSTSGRETLVKTVSQDSPIFLAHLSFDGIPGTKMANPKDRPFSKELPMAR